MLSIVKDSYAEAYGGQAEPESVESGASIGRGLMRRADKLCMNHERISVSDAVSIAEIYGRTERIAEYLGDEDQVLISRGRLGQLLSKLVITNRDQAKRAASEILEQIGNQYFSRRKYIEAAIELTNAAMVVNEMHNPTLKELENSRSILRRTLQMRKKNTIDFAYSEFNLAISERLLAKRQTGGVPRELFSPIFTKLEKAHKVFVKFGDYDHYSVYLRARLELLTDWLLAEHDRILESRLAAIPEFIDLANSIGLNEHRPLARLLTTNPESLGLDRTPDWLPSEESNLSEALSSVPELSCVLDDIAQYKKGLGANDCDLDLKLFELESVVYPVRRSFTDPFTAINRLWADQDYELFLIKATSLLQWENSDQFERKEYLLLLNRLPQCIAKIIETWNDFDIEGLMKRNPTAFRFAACELMEFGEWDNAFRLLELTRGVVASGLYHQIVQIGEANVPIGTDFVHVTHSPTATYVVMKQADSFVGSAFLNLNGKVLAAGFSGLSPAGLLIAQLNRNRSRAMSAARELHEQLSDVGDWIDARCSESVVIMAGGLFQSFPVWSTGNLGKSVLSGQKRVFHSTSLKVASYLNGHRFAGDLKEQLSLQCAAEVPGQLSLPKAGLEPELIGRAAPRGWDVEIADATAESLTIALSEPGITHFTGHSMASPNPKQSRLITYGSSLSVDDILNRDHKSRLVVLGSCQSALTYGLAMQDEVLSIQTALWYRGSESVIGTYWPISDDAGIAFSTHFFSLLFELVESDSVSVEANLVQQCWRKTINWMRQATEDEVQSLFLENAASVSPQYVGSGLAFHFYDWAAFQMFGVPYETA